VGFDFWFVAVIIPDYLHATDLMHDPIPDVLDVRGHGTTPRDRTLVVIPLDEVLGESRLAELVSFGPEHLDQR
jgi:hypothetical protein